MKKEATFPMRINKYLAWKNVSTRRGADEMVKAGQVRVNGRLAVLGDKVREDDQVTVLKNTRQKKRLVYYAFNKPKGIATHSPQKGEPGIKESFKFPEKVFPLGRLDKDSQGLLIFTNDGRITERLLSPEYYHEKEYVVRVAQDVTPDFVAKWQRACGLKMDM
jgi:23S rRNA pseudouridine2604 synthase